MMQPVFHFCRVFLFLFSISTSFSNNLVIADVVPDQEVNNKLKIDLNVSWDNSWRDSENWDAVWLFAKYREVGGDWHHCTIDSTNSVLLTTQSSDDHTGAYVYRNIIGSGNISPTAISIFWNFTTDGVSDLDNVEFHVFGIEMVYIPQGSFYVGDGETTDVYAHFEDANTGQPFLVANENQITLGGGTVGSLGNNNAANQYTHGTPLCSGCLEGSGDDFNDVTSQTLPAAFPKGYEAFYIMKYELTQQQWVDFLNMVTTQQLTMLTETGHFHPSEFAATQSRWGIVNNGGVYSTTEPYLPVIFMDWVRGAAYGDWCGLRPMTELEFEKACRGPITPVTSEYVWGTTGIELGSNLTNNNIGLSNEGIASGYSTSGLGNCWINDNSGTHNMSFVTRVGIFAGDNANSDRISAGATYYGVMEMGGNAWDRNVSVGHTEGRKFTGLHGDGELSVNGYADVANWPGSFSTGLVETNVGVGYRGGGLAWPTPNTEHNARISSRRLTSGYWNTVIHDDGIRFVKTAD